MSKAKKQEKHNETGHDAPRLKSIPEVLNYLTGQGFKVARRTLYLHKQQGILREQVGGGFSLKAVDDYARRNLDRPGIYAPAPAMLTDDKARLLKAQANKIEFENELKTGKYMLREDVEARWVRAAAFLKQDLLNFGPRMVDLALELVIKQLRTAGIDTDATGLHSIGPDLLESYDRGLELWLDRYVQDGKKHVQESMQA